MFVMRTSNVVQFTLTNTPNVRPSAFGQERDKKQSFEMRIAKTFLSMTSAFTLALFPSIVSVVVSALTLDQSSPPLPVYSMKACINLFILCNEKIKAGEIPRVA